MQVANAGKSAFTFINLVLTVTTASVSRSRFWLLLKLLLRNPMNGIFVGLVEAN